MEPKSGKLSGQKLICISGIFKMIFRWGDWRVEFQFEAGNIPGLLPNINNMCIQKQGILRMKHQGQNLYTYKGEY